MEHLQHLLVGLDGACVIGSAGTAIRRYCYHRYRTYVAEGGHAVVRLRCDERVEVVIFFSHLFNYTCIGNEC